MATPGMQWATLIGNLLNQGNEQTLQGLRVGQGQQQLDIEKQQQEHQNRAADLAFHQHLTELGARPVVNGLVKEEQPVPDLPAGSVPGLPSGITPAKFLGLPETVSVMRKADPSRLVKFKDSTGDPVAYELPSVGSQAWRQMMQARAQAQSEAGGMQSEAEARGRTTGAEEAQQDFRQKYGMPLSPELEQQYGVPAGQHWLPNEVAMLAWRYNLVRGAEARAQGTITREDMREKAAKDLQSMKDEFTGQQNRQKLDWQNRWANLRASVATSGQNSLNARQQLSLLDRNQREHGQVLDELYKEQQRQLAAQPLLDVDGTPDGVEVVDPWSGRKFIMNGAQRMRVKNALDTSQQLAVSLGQRASDIERRYNFGTTPAQPGATQQEAATGGKGPVKTATQEQVARYAKKKGIDIQKALEEFRGSNYQVK